MNSKERFITSLNHLQPDKIPVDFGATAVTGIHIKQVELLRNYFGFQKKPVKVIEPYQMLGEIDDELIEAIGIDVIGLIPQKNMFGISQENWKEFKTFWGQVVLVPGDFNTKIDMNGDLLIFPQGDTSVKASARMPMSGYFFDAIIRQKPIVEQNLNPLDNLEEFVIMSDEDLTYWKDILKKYSKSDKGIIANLGGTGLGDIALVPGMNLKSPSGIRDVSEWYMSTVLRPDYIHQIFEKQTDIAIENLKKISAIDHNVIDAVFICGTDFGTQNSQFCSKETFEELYAPYYRKMNNWIHENTRWKTFKHSCGAIEPLMQSFINAGFDIINPVQISATGMNPEMLKNKYGKKLTFWGGGIDTQNVLAFGTPEQVKEQMIQLCNIFSQHGGFVFNTVHNIQANVPFNNLITLIEILKKINFK